MVAILRSTEACGRWLILHPLLRIYWSGIDLREEVDWEGMAATRRSVREYLDTLDEAA